jgi:four helix bundle protein
MPSVGGDVSGFDRFEDIIAWQKARTLTKRIYQLTRQGVLAGDRGLTSQMQRAAVSTMANIAEGFERDGLGEFQRYLIIAKASCGELKSHCYAALDAGYFDESTFAQLAAQTEEVARLIRGLRASVIKRRAHPPPDTEHSASPTAVGTRTRHSALSTEH